MFLYTIDDEVSLKLFTVQDDVELFNLTNSSKEYLREWLSWVDYTQQVNDSRNWILSTISGVVESGGHPKVTAIFYEGNIAGTIGFNMIDRLNKSVKIGYWIGEKYQGKGIMTRACKGLVDYGFKEMDLNRIEISVAEKNYKSRAIPEKLGFKEEGIVRQVELLDNQYVNHVIYSKLASEWLKN